VIDDSRAIDQEDTPEQGDVLPHFGLAWNRSDFAHSLRSQGVDDGTLANVGVSNESDADLLLVLVQLRELS